MPVVPIMMVASVALQGASMIQQNRANKASANLANQTADYNARVDLAEGRQIEMDSDANIRRTRQEGSIYISRQKAAYAASGVLASGSPLAVEAMTAGRIEQQAQQERSNSLREVAKRESAARVGVMYGDAQSKAIMRQNSVDMLRGGAGILSTVSQGYTSGAFASWGVGGKGGG